MTSILALNVANPPARRVQGLLEWVWHQPDDVVVFTEMGRGEGSQLITQVCRASGFDVVASDPAHLGVLVAGRGVTVRADDSVPPPGVLPGRVAPVVVEVPGGAPVRLAAIYGAASDPVRYSGKAQRQRKRDWLAAFEEWLPGWRAHHGPAVLIGDLNIVDPDSAGGLGNVLPEELDCYRGLSERHGLIDALRHLHPDAGATHSWVDHTGAGCRYDHAFVSPDLTSSVQSCDLLDAPRQAGLTDHSALRLILDS